LGLNWYLVSSLIVCGAGVLGFSIYLASRIIAELPDGIAKGGWYFLRILIILFVAGYIVYWIILDGKAASGSLIVGSIFLAGAIFVVVVCWLMLKTVKNIKRMSELERENITDQLLGIYNRRYLDQRLKEEIARAKRYKLPLSLLMMDIDHFKNVNDTYGHQAGDKVLISIGKILLANMREADLSARYGGEELVVVLPHTGEANALIMAERLRQLIGQINHSANSDNQYFHVTISIGLATIEDVKADVIDLLLCADKALYRAKHNGRNQVVIYDPNLKDDLSFTATR